MGKQVLTHTSLVSISTVWSKQAKGYSAPLGIDHVFSHASKLDSPKSRIVCVCGGWGAIFHVRSKFLHVKVVLH